MCECDSTEGIYTQEQLDYVAGVEDELVRDHLLHVSRLLDNIRGDRNAFEQKCYKLEDQVIELKQLLKQQEE